MRMVQCLEGNRRGAGDCAGLVPDSISLREFLGCGLSKSPPKLSSLSKTQRWLGAEARAAVFDRVTVAAAWPASDPLSNEATLPGGINQ